MRPDFIPAYGKRGSAWEKKGNLDKALEDYKNVLELNPNLVEAYVAIGNIWFGKGHFDQAIFYHTNALTIDPRNFKALASRGDAWYKKGDIQNAIRDYNSALELNPNNGHVANNFAWVLATYENSMYRNGLKAVELALKAVEMEPNEYSLGTLAAAYAEVGSFDEAIKTQERAIDMIDKQTDREKLIEFQNHLKKYTNKKPWREICE
jgi:tetratricopeptide (TPR) repeat protein